MAASLLRRIRSGVFPLSLLVHVLLLVLDAVHPPAVLSSGVPRNDQHVVALLAGAVAVPVPVHASVNEKEEGPALEQKVPDVLFGVLVAATTRRSEATGENE